MRKHRSTFTLSIALILLTAALPAAAQTSGSDRLFLAFAEEAAIVDSQWWEGRVELSEGAFEPIGLDATVLTGIAAFEIRENLEVGGRVGFGDTDTPGGVPDGSGATDLDLWGKYRFAPQGDIEWAVGGGVIVPTGDDTAGLGMDAFSINAFGSMRYKLSRGIISGHAGVRMNGDGMALGGPEIEGKTAAMLGGGYIHPVSDRVTLVGELVYEGKRFEGVDASMQVLGGFNWRIQNRGMVRAAIAFGLEDGAPDTEFLAGYAFQF
jgi:hypothetical protein